MKQTIPTLLGLLLLWSSITRAQDLPRRAYLGIRMENITQDVRQLLNLGDKTGVLIAQVFPQSTAETSGFQKGDVLISLNGQSLESTDKVLQVLATPATGSKFSYELIRNQQPVKGSSVFQPYPQEKYPDIDVLYTASRSAIGLQRSIVTKPRASGKFPLVVFIGGIGCYSLDTPLDTNRSELRLLNYLTRKGFMTARLEKPGMGDNARSCKPCQEVGFMEETEGYLEAVRMLKKRPDVDSSAVYIIGHSMGGVFAPLIAQKTPIKGIAAYGTIGANFIEYLARTRRTIASAYRMSPEETDDLVKDFCECAGYYFVEKMSVEAAAAKKSICNDYLSIFELRSRKYNDELYNLNIPALWRPYSGNVLLLWGESDYIAAREDHEILLRAIRFYHPDKAAFQSVQHSDHGMNFALSFQDARDNPGQYSPTVGEIIGRWLSKIN